MEDKFVRKVTQDDFVTEKNDIIKNNLLGFYDNNNEYHISAQIIEELIAIEKLKKSSFGNSVFCVGNLLGYGEIVFEIVYNNKTENTNAQAFLFVLENVDKINGYLQNTIRTQIAHFSSEVSDFIEESYKKFNIVGTLDDEGMIKKSLDEISLDDSYILAKKAYSLLLDKLEDERVLDAYGKYFTARLAILTKFDNPFTNDVLSRFNEEYTLIHGVFLQQKNYKTLNELLDKCIEEASGINPEYLQLEEDFNNAIKADKDKFVDSMNNISEKSEDKAIDMLEKGDREKIKEILSSNEKYEKDLSSEELLNSEAIAPKQSLETLATEIEELTSKDEKDFSSLILNSSIQSEEILEEPIEEIQEEKVEIVEESEEDEFEDVVENEIESDVVEEVQNEESVDISAFFDNDEREFEESKEESQEIEESQSFFEELKEYVEESASLESVEDLFEEKEEFDENEIQEDISENIQEVDENNFEDNTIDIVEEIQEDVQEIEEEKVVEEKQPSDQYKERTSSSIFDRLNKLNNNMKNTTKTYQKPKVENSNKLEKLYDLLDRSMDR